MEKLKDSMLGDLLQILLFCVVTMSIMLALFSYIKFPSVSGTSMLPSFEDGDVMLALHTKKVDFNDVIVAKSDSLHGYVVKRVIGVAGDHIEIKNKILYRNDEALSEPYLYSQDWCLDTDTLDVIVPDGQIFIMGDNRVASLDSRAFGTVAVTDVYAKVVCDLTKCYRKAKSEKHIGRKVYE